MKHYQASEHKAMLFSSSHELGYAVVNIMIEPSYHKHHLIILILHRKNIIDKHYANQTVGIPAIPLVKPEDY